MTCLVNVAVALLAAVAAGQLLPPPGDGEIRTVYRDLRNETEVWLTLEPRRPKGDRVPLITFTHRFSGRRPAGPATGVEVRALAGNYWAPRVELWFLLDEGQKIDLGGQASGLTTGAPSDYLSGQVSIATLKKMAGAARITGSALGFAFELNESQRDAIRAFLARVTFDNPDRTSAASTARVRAVPADLAALAARARLDGPVAAWCRAEFRPGAAGAFAVGVTSPGGGGRYIAIDADGRASELGAFKGLADVACHTRAWADTLDAAIRESETIHGHITPRWNTTVVCGFIDDTSATCWQYSPGDRTFVQVGEWVT
jgi:hypothetical protein